MKKSTSLFFCGNSLIVHQLFTCRTICPRRDRRGRNHLHPQVQPTSWFHSHFCRTICTTQHSRGSYQCVLA